MADETIQLDVVADLSRVQRDIESLTGTTIKLRTTADTSTATKEIDKAAKDRSATIKADADAKGASAELDRAAKDRTTTIKADVDTSSVGKIKAKLQGLLSGQKIDIGGGSIDLEGLASKVPGLDKFSGQIGKLPQLLGNTAEAAAGAGEGVASLGSSAAAAGPAIAVLAGAMFELKAVGDTLAVAKKIDLVAKASGLAAEEASKLVFVVDQLSQSSGLDISTGDLLDVVNNIQGKIPELQKIGVAVDPGGDAVANLTAVADAIANAATETERATIASAALGEEGARQFVPLLRDGGAALRELADSIPEGSIFSDEDLQNAREFEEGVAKVKAQFQAVFLAVGKELLPTLKLIGTTLEAWAPAIEVVAKVIAKAVQLGLGLGSFLVPIATGLGKIFGDSEDGADKAAASADDLAASMGDVTTAADLAAERAAAIADVIDSAIGKTAALTDATRSVGDAYATIAKQASDPLTLQIDAEAAANDLARALADQVQAEVDLGLIAPDDQLATLRSRIDRAVDLTKLTPQVDTEALRGQIDDALSVAFDPTISLTDAQIDVQGALDTIAQQVQDAAGGEGVTIPTTLDARKSADDLAQALSKEVQANVDLGLIAPEDQIVALRDKIQAAIGTLSVNPEVNASRITELQSILDRLKAPDISPQVNPATIAQLEGIRAKLSEPINVSFKVAQEEGVPLALAEKAAAKTVPVTADTTQAQAAIDALATTPKTVPVAADTTSAQASISAIESKAVDITTSAPGLDVILEKYTRIRDKAVAITFTAPGLAPIVEQYERLRAKTVSVNFSAVGLTSIEERLARIRDKTITITVQTSGTIPGNWMGGPLSAGQVSWVSERGQEMFVGASGARYLLPKSQALFAAPEAGRVLTSAQTNAVIRHEQVAHHSTTTTTSASITVVSPHPKLAGQDVKRVLEGGGRRR